MNYLALIKALSISSIVIVGVSAKMGSKPKRKITLRAQDHDDDVTKIGGTIVNIRSGGGRSFVQVRPDQGSEFWLSTPEANFAKGDRISCELTVPRVDYYAPSIDRRFAEIYFTNYYDLTPGGGAQNGSLA